MKYESTVIHKIQMSKECEKSLGRLIANYYSLSTHTV
jgi:hypothetical protein